MTQFKAYRIYDDSGKIRAGFEQCSVDQLSPGEVVIRTQYSSINYKDALAATGAGRILRKSPTIGGIDLAGTVVSSSDARFRAGDEVLATGFDIGVAHDGGYAEYARLPAGWVVPLPKGIKLFDAMAIGTAGFTAALAITRMELNGLRPENGPVIVTGASGGVGSIAVDMLAALGYQVSAVTGKASEHEMLRTLGAREILDRHTLQRGTRPLEKTVWAGAVDNLGGDWLAWLTRSMKIHGTIASIGMAAGADVNTTVMPFILRGVALLGVDSANTQMPVRQKVWARLATDLKPRHLAQLAHTIEFAQLPETFPRFIEGKVTGRTVVRIAS